MNSVPISAAKARAKLVYERLINFINDQGTIDALQFLMIREITYDSLLSRCGEHGQTRFLLRRHPPILRIVDQYCNDLTVGDKGEPDSRRPWNQGGDWQMVDAPAFQLPASNEPVPEPPADLII